MKMKYGIPKMDVVPFAAEDIIAASMIEPTVPGTDPTDPTIVTDPSSGLTNGGTGSGDSADFTDMFPGLN